MPALHPAFMLSSPIPVRTSRHLQPSAPRRRTRSLRTAPTAKMVRVSVPLNVEAPRTHCYELFSDLSRMPEWSSTLEEVARDESDPSFSEWKFAWNGVRLSWRARDVEPDGSDEPGTAIRWRSVSGLTHIGAVEFEELEPAKTKMVMTVDYDIASLLAVIMQSALVSDFVEGAIESDLQRFRHFALRMHRKQRIEARKSV